MSKIHLIRHGKVDAPAALYGHTDVSVQQSINKDILAGIINEQIRPQLIITSPLLRCYQLAQTLAEYFDISPHRYAAFKEMNFGDFDGIPFDDLHLQTAQWQLLERFWQNPVQQTLPNAELLAGFSYRTFHGWNNLIKQHTDNKSDDTVVICHGGIIRMILAHILDVDWRNATWYTSLNIANGSMTTLNLINEKVSVDFIAKPLIDVQVIA